MPDDLVFRPVKRTDIDAVAALEAASFPVPWKREFFIAEVDSIGRFNLTVSLPDGRLVGYVFTMFFLDEMHVNKIAVDPSLRRMGIAKRLMAKCFEFATENEIKTISLEVRDSNHAARELYKGLGFLESYRRPRYYPDGEAAIVMTCEMATRPDVA